MIRTLIVDDEEIARRGLRARLERVIDVDIVGDCTGGREAIAAIGRKSPDLVFLDVQMPELSGFELVDQLPASRPLIVFVTTFDQYAVRAFEVRAFDYLLKPVDDERLAETLRRVRAAMTGGQALAIAPPRARSDRLAIPAGDRLMVVRASDIDWVEASGNYVAVHIGRKSWLLRDTIAAIDQRLAPYGFSRIHRSTLVNVQRVSELRSLQNGEFAVLLQDGTALKLSRGYRGALDQLVGSRL